jgi:hypothetical protein
MFLDMESGMSSIGLIAVGIYIFGVVCGFGLGYSVAALIWGRRYDAKDSKSV